MSQPTDSELQTLLVNAMTATFNRSLRALEDAGAIDARKLREAYTGIGDPHYDAVTWQIEHTAGSTIPGLRELFAKP